jgi:membrane-bound serine protease (ClpP class)
MNHRRLRNILHAFLLAWLAIALLAGYAAGQSGGSVVKLARFQGPVTPVLASYIDRAIDEAEASGAAAVVIELDTPGGSTDITKQITQRMTAATVPIIVYVAPSGAHAGSAGTFITLAGHLAAMAPGSSIGAASPVSGEGADLDATMKAKVTNILVADIKNLAARRGERAVAWAEKAVAEAAAATAQEALDLGVIDVVAPDVQTLLGELDGRQVEVAGETVTLLLSDLPVEEVALSPVEGLLNQLVNPAIAAILLTIGINALLFELSSPGGYAVGIIGVICLLLAFYALGTLNANWAGLAFVVLAFVLFVLDIKAPTHGALTAGGLASFVFGSYLLFNTGEMVVPWPSIIGSALATALFFAFAVSMAVRAQRRPPVIGMTAMVGAVAEVRQPLEPQGMVFVNGEWWQAQAVEGAVPAGEKVIVTGQDGMVLRVRRMVTAGEQVQPAGGSGKFAYQIMGDEQYQRALEDPSIVRIEFVGYDVSYVGSGGERIPLYDVYTAD